MNKLIKIIAIIFTFSIISCGESNDEKYKAKVKQIIDNRDSLLKLTNTVGNNSGNFLHCNQYFLENCQYIRVSHGQDSWGSHKGNCTNPIHDYNKLYTEKEVLDIFRQYSYDEHLISESDLKEWFKQFKK